MAGRVVLTARDLEGARRAAQAALEERARGEPRWSLGVLRPLTPMAPGTHRYGVTFARWQAEEDRFVRRDVHALEVWAADAQSARRLAQREVQGTAGYAPAWRIRSVTRLGRGGDGRPA